MQINQISIEAAELDKRSLRAEPRTSRHFKRLIGIIITYLCLYLSLLFGFYRTIATVTLALEIAFAKQDLQAKDFDANVVLGFLGTAAKVTLARKPTA